MWIMTTIGFFSVTESPAIANHLQVRARCRADLEALLDRMDARNRIVRTPKADYLWRVVVRPRTWARWASTLALDVDYGNFKNEVKKTNPDRAKAYEKVWTELRALEGEDQEAP